MIIHDLTACMNGSVTWRSIYWHVITEKRAKHKSPEMKHKLQTSWGGVFIGLWNSTSVCHLCQVTTAYIG